METAHPRLLDLVRRAIRARRYSRKTEKAYIYWIRRFIFFHGKRHPTELGEAEIAAFLTSLATDGRVSASTQNQALSALLFLYRNVLEREIQSVGGVVPARRPERLPVVLTREEVQKVLRCLEGVPWLMAMLLYGAGLRLMERCRLRIKDVDFGKNQIVVRNGDPGVRGKNSAGAFLSRGWSGSRNGATVTHARAVCRHNGEARDEDQSAMMQASNTTMQPSSGAIDLE